MEGYPVEEPPTRTSSANKDKGKDKKDVKSKVRISVSTYGIQIFQFWFHLQIVAESKPKRYCFSVVGVSIDSSDVNLCPWQLCKHL